VFPNLYDSSNCRDKHNRDKQTIQKIYTCTIKEISNIKLSHTHGCYINTTLCKATFLVIQLLSPHFPKVRYIIFSL